MRKQRIMFAVVACISTGAAYSAPQKPLIAGGVDIRAVDWSKVCPSVTPVAVTRAGVTCATVHPTSGAVQVWQDWAHTGKTAPAPNCEFEARWFARLTKPGAGGSPWGNCKESFMGALNDRAGTRIKFDDMTLEQFRTKYFPASVIKENGEERNVR